jgi:hypothetical protein
MRRERQKVVPLARGEVLDIGIGTSLDLPSFGPWPDEVHRWVGPVLELHPLALRRVAQTGLSSLRSSREERWVQANGLIGS